MSAMTAQQIMQDSYLVRMRALKDEVARLKDELQLACAERDSLRQHFALALLAARDADQIPPGGALLVVDGWNAIFGSIRLKRLDEQIADQAAPVPESPPAHPTQGWRKQLIAVVRQWLDARPDDRAWIVFDGPRATGKTSARLRVSYTGGKGAHRADRLVCDYLRMRRYDGRKGKVIVVTNDRGFRLEAERLGAETTGIEELNGNLVLGTMRERTWIRK